MHLQRPCHTSSTRALQGWFRQRFPHQQRWRVFRGFRAAIVLVAALMAMFVPGFGAFISLIGSLACALLAFVIPAFCHLRIFGDTMPRWVSAGLCIVFYDWA